MGPYEPYEESTEALEGPTSLWTPPSSITRTLSPPSGATRNPLPHLNSNLSQCSTTHTHLPYLSSNQSCTAPSPNHSTQPTITAPQVHISHLALHIELNQGHGEAYIRQVSSTGLTLRQGGELTWGHGTETERGVRGERREGWISMKPRRQFLR